MDGHSQYVYRNGILLFQFAISWTVKLTEVPLAFYPDYIDGQYYRSYLRNSLFDCHGHCFGLRYLFYKFDWPIIPFILCLVLGERMEISFIQSLETSGNLFILQRPILAIFAISLFILCYVLPRFKNKQRLKQEREEQELS